MTMKNREKQAPASLAEKQREMPLTVANYKLMLIGLGIIILGFILMSGGGSAERFQRGYVQLPADYAGSDIGAGGFRFRDLRDYEET